MVVKSLGLKPSLDVIVQFSSLPCLGRLQIESSQAAVVSVEMVQTLSGHTGSE